MDIATTILQQLGGNRFLVMTGAHTLLAGKDSLQMKLPKISRSSAIIITLEADDTYTLQAYRGRSFVEYGKLTGIHCAELKGAFEDLTGLYTKL